MPAERRPSRNWKVHAPKRVKGELRELCNTNTYAAGIITHGGYVTCSKFIRLLLLRESKRGGK